MGRGPVSLRLVTHSSDTPDPTREPTAPTRTPDPSPGPHRPSGAINLGPVEYRGQPLDAERGPGLGCFRFQLAILVVLIVATPLSVGRLPEAVTVVLLFAVIGLLLVSGQTIIFLLRLISADRRGRRQPMAGRSQTVGQLEDAAAAASSEAAASSQAAASSEAASEDADEGPPAP
jgi:hypothetical protein